MLELKEISKRFGAVRALEKTSLNLMPGEIRALLGSNGSGKSTLVKILGGLVKKDGGEIFLDEEELHISSPRVSYKNGIAVAYQDLSLIQHLTAAENIFLGHEPGGALGLVKRKKMIETARSILEQLGVHINPNTMVKHLDNATQSMIEIAKTLSWHPKIILLDEVTASLHKAQVKRVFDFLRELKLQNAAILVVTHRLDEVFELCDSITVLRNGHNVIDVSVSDVEENDLVFYMTGKRIEKIQKRVRTENNLKKRTTRLEVRDIVVGMKVNGVSMTAYPGEIIGIAGLQGQGQSEFLRALYGYLLYRKGEIYLNGKIAQFRTPADAVKKGFGFIPDDREKEGVFPIRSIVENLNTAEIGQKHLLQTINPSKNLADGMKLIKKLNITIGKPQDQANTLSGGNQQKLVVGRWLRMKPKILLLDDPTKGVDILSRREIHSLIQRMAQEGTTVIIASSDNEELIEISERILVFYEGRIIAELSGETVTEEHLITAMLGVNGFEGEEER